MTNAATTIRVFGGYLLLVGLSLVAVPNVVGSVLQIPAAAHEWLRPLGVALLALSYYYFRSAGAGYRPFYAWSVHVRVGQFVAFILLTSMGLLPPLILIPSAIEFSSGLWTWFALRTPANA